MGKWERVTAPPGDWGRPAPPLGQVCSMSTAGAARLPDASLVLFIHQHRLGPNLPSSEAQVLRDNTEKPGDVSDGWGLQERAEPPRAARGQPGPSRCQAPLTVQVRLARVSRQRWTRGHRGLRLAQRDAHQNFLQKNSCRQTSAVCWRPSRAAQLWGLRCPSG